MKESQNRKKWRSRLTKSQILTVPNILSFFRLALIPLIIWMYCVEKSPLWTLGIIILSGITDVVDGAIARHFNMITDFGKALDPIADKLTQIAILICLLFRFPLMWLPLGLMFVKEIVAFTLKLLIFNKTDEVTSAEWHGKINTLFLYIIMALHVVWYDIPSTVSTVCIIISTSLMLLSFSLYTVSSARVLRSNSKKNKNS